MKDVKEEMMIYDLLPQVVRGNLSVNVNPYCNSITFINQGNSFAVINNTFRVYPGTIGTNSGETFSLGGNRGEIFRGRIDVAFDIAGGTNILIILQKVYIPEQK